MIRALIVFISFAALWVVYCLVACSLLLWSMP